MKFVIAVAVSLMAFGAFANDIKSTVANIEAETNSKCKLIETSNSICGGLFGAAYSKCTYKETYLCESDSDILQYQLRILSSFNFRTNKRDLEVTSIIDLN